MLACIRLMAALMVGTSLVEAMALPVSDVSQSGVLTLPIARSVQMPGSESGLKRSSGHIAQMSITDTKVSYSVLIAVGSPQQNVSVILDTGSSDLWLPSPGSIAQCSQQSSSSSSSQGVQLTQQINCSDPLYFDQSKSSSFHLNSSQFDISYRDGTHTSGQWATDDVSIGNAKVSGLSLAVANKTNATSGILGIGYPGSESTVTSILNGEPQNEYSNLPLLLKQQGVIYSQSYSLWIDGFNSGQGEIAFGGVDHSRYTGTLQTVPIVHTYKAKEPISLSVMLHGLSYAQSTSQSNVSSAQSLVSCSVPVLLDSGTTINYVPQAFIDVLATQFNASYSDSVGAYIMPCDTPGTVVFDFSGALIPIDMKNMAMPLETTSSPQALNKDGVAMCAIPFFPSTSSFILGDAFMRGVYSVFDLGNQEVAIAPVNSQGSDSNVEAISNKIPSATAAPSYSSTSSSDQYSTASLSGTASTPHAGYAAAGSSITQEAASMMSAITAAPSVSGMLTREILTATGHPPSGSHTILATASNVIDAASTGNSASGDTSSTTAQAQSNSGVRVGSCFTTILTAILVFLL